MPIASVRGLFISCADYLELPLDTEDPSNVQHGVGKNRRLEDGQTVYSSRNLRN